MARKQDKKLLTCESHVDSGKEVGRDVGQYPDVVAFGQSREGV